jgi:hypothetical protein
MHLKISYSEINAFIRKNIRQPLQVSYGYDKKINIKYTYKTNVFLIGDIEKDISISLSVYYVYSDKVIFQADSGAIVKMFLPAVLNSVANKNQLNFLSASGDKITLDISKIEGASSILNMASLNSIDISNVGVDVQVTLK